MNNENAVLLGWVIFLLLASLGVWIKVLYKRKEFWKQRYFELKSENKGQLVLYKSKPYTFGSWKNEDERLKEIKKMFHPPIPSSKSNTSSRI